MLIFFHSFYVGQLHPIISEPQLKELFGIFGDVVSCKIHKEPQHRSYCFIEFKTNHCAYAARVAMNMRKLHEIPVEVNWANTNSTLYNKKKLPQDKFGVFIGDIPPEFTNDELFKLFSQSFPHVVDARIVVEPLSQKSKQYRRVGLVCAKPGFEFRVFCLVYHLFLMDSSTSL